MDRYTEAMNGLMARLESVPVVPVLVIDDAGHAVPVARALAAGGLPIAEITLRTACAPEAIAAVAAAAPGVSLGAGTVLNAEHVRIAVDAGASYIVSPGLSDDVVETSRSLGVPVIPGVATATEVQRAWNMGLRVLKFFPAGQAGGVPMMKALGSVFRDVKFVPTGGVSASNLSDYLALPSVLACGGSWLAKANTIQAGDFEAITALAREAVEAAERTRG